MNLQMASYYYLVLALASLKTTTTAFQPSSFSRRHDIATNTAKTTTSTSSTSSPSSCTTTPRIIPTALNGSIRQVGAATRISTMTVIQLKTLLRENGLKVSGNKAELEERLMALAQQRKEENIAKLSAMAVEMKEKQKEKPLGGRPPPSLKEQVEGEVENRKRKQQQQQQQTAATNNSNEAKTGFRDIGVPPSLVARLDEMGIFDPTPIQKQAIPLALKGRDVMGLAQTGTGKTLAFGIPLVSQMMDDLKLTKKNSSRNNNSSNENGSTPPPTKAIRGLVLAPTRELANQIAVQLGTLTRNTPIDTFVVMGGKNIKTQINQLNWRKGGMPDLLVATPGRLIDLMDRGALSLKQTSFLVLDEADLMLDMGFLPSLHKIAAMLPKQRQSMLFSATMSKDMGVVADSYLQDPIRVEVARAGQTADKITQELHYVAREDKSQLLLNLLKNPQHKHDRAIVFGRTKHGMEKLSKKLIANGILAGAIHGNKSQPQRDRAIAAFKTGEIKVLVATDVAARGLDIPDVKRVYNYELPNVPEAYVHRIGRTARAGKEGAAIAFCSVEEMDDLLDIQKVTGLKIPVVSGDPWSKHETKREKEVIKTKQIIEQRRRRDSVNRKRQGGGKRGK